MIEAGSLKSVVTSLEFFLSSWGPGNMLHIVKSLEGPEGPLEASRKALVALERLFPSAADHNATGTKRRATAISYAKLAWPFKEEKARKILNDIARCKATISLALTTNTANDTKIIKANVERLCEALDLETLKKVLKWLVTTDPSPNHNTACALHDSQTGTWITRSNECKDWKNGSARFLWFHGIPGAGKMIIFSYVVEDIKHYCKTIGNKDITHSYYYCYLGRSQDEVPHILRWVINQLCRKSQYVPKEELDCFRTGEEPSLVLLAASRKEIDIEISLTPISTNISLSNPHVDEDIQIYIANQLQDHHKLRTWPKSLADEISAALIKGAKGMFRWAACQIDILGRLHNVSDIRKALHELPETLDETYERILMKIPQKSAKLHINYGGSRFQELNVLAEVVVVDVEQLSFSPEQRLLDRNALFEICTCSITLTSEDKVSLAHYSVQEYLVSERIQLGPATSFQISKRGYYVLAAKICLIYVLDITYEGLCSSKDYFGMSRDQQMAYCYHEEGIFPLLSTAFTWDQYVNQHPQIWSEQGPDTAILDSLFIRLFNPKGLHYKKWLDRAELALVFASACGYNLVGTATAILESNPNLAISGDLLEADFDYTCYGLNVVRAGTRLDLLDVAIYFFKDKSVKLLLDWGANPNARSFLTMFKIIERLLGAGVNPSPGGLAITPLQVAALCNDSLIVKRLLDAGAHVNAVGDDEAVVAGLERRSTTKEDLLITESDLDRNICDIEGGYLSKTEISELICTRSSLRNYDTPLRIVENQLDRAVSHRRSRLLEMKKYLVENGGKALKIYPG
ncbi:hypothetical protein MMC31_005646 [Peltigera leucophlebia]|nr:hypothetical protein [Peltigera leucophlebia]